MSNENWRVGFIVIEKGMLGGGIGIKRICVVLLCQEKKIIFVLFIRGIKISKIRFENMNIVLEEVCGVF